MKPNDKYTIVNVNSENLSDHPQVICYINPKQPTYSLKMDWLKKRFREGLRIKLLYLEGEKRPVGFIEYVSGESCWRAVSADGYLFIHCIWVSAKKHKNKEYGTLLLKDCIEDASENGFVGVATMTSSGSFMADKSLFIKNGFRVVDSAGPSDDLLSISLKNGPIPYFNDWKRSLAGYNGWHIVYSSQCPWVARFVSEMIGSPLLKKINLKITEIKTPKEAQAAPSPYAVFTLIRDGRILADRYISETRFKNILKKEKI